MNEDYPDPELINQMIGSGQSLEQIEINN